MATTAQNTMAILQATLEQFKNDFGNGGDLKIPLAELQARLEADTQKIAELAENETGKRGKGRKARKSRDPERPKRGKSAFFLWCDDNRATVKAQLETEREETAKRDAWVRETARLLHTLKAAAFDDACKWARSRLDALGDAPPRAASGVWHTCDDDDVSVVSVKRVLAESAYMLFYERLDDGKPRRSPRSADPSEFTQGSRGGNFEWGARRNCATVAGAGGRPPAPPRTRWS